jgi:hypothetical protein
MVPSSPFPFPDPCDIIPSSPMNDQANIAIQNVHYPQLSTRDDTFRSTLLSLEQQVQSRFWPWAKLAAARGQVFELARGYAELTAKHITAINGVTAITRAVVSAAGDKAARAIEGMLLYPNPHLKSDTDPEVARDPIVSSVAALEDLLKPFGGEGSAIESITGDQIAALIRSLREQIRILALGYTKAQSDMNARAISSDNDKNFAQSMGDAYKFQSFLDQHFHNDLVNNPGMKILEIAESVMRGLMEKR